MKKEIYFINILLGLSYFIVKLIFFIQGMLGIGALILGIISSLLTIGAGIFTYNEYKKEDKEKKKPIGHWLNIVFPILIILLTPIIMIYERGALWLEGIARLLSFIIFVVVAIIQLIIAIYMNKSYQQILSRT